MWMSRMLASGVLCALIATVSSLPASHNQRRRQAILPCDHPLRIVSPSLFSHCGTICAYSEWTEWETVQHRIPTTTSYCASRIYYAQQRTRQILSVIGDRADCNEAINQTQKICYPTKEERLIYGLGLGGSGQDTGDTGSPGGILSRRLNINQQTPHGSGTRCPHGNTLSTGEVCQHLSASRACKRSTGEYHNANNVERLITSSSRSVLSDNSAPISFDWNIHGSHFRQRRQTRCSDDDTQYVLFVLDSSGSISQSDFTKMKEAVADLVPLFCKKIKTALINFSSDIRLEYCFDCFTNNVHGRAETTNSIKQAEYLGDCTNTGATAKCICEDILGSSCGISSTPDCLDVIFITDGHSNDPNLKVCDEISCLHNRAGINTYAVGIGGYNPNELDCIENSSDDFGMFEYDTFQEFRESIDNVMGLVTDAVLGGDFHSCATRDRSFSPTGSPYAG